ncbi:MAG: hypothetical protein LBK60_06260 [Verrucomicrobiales bacterium]|jgi:hypothetical protein|nr:hypothetical protein [Verrucomicrobiales bacterium]
MLWKNNWEETQRHFIKWWNREGLVVGKWGAFDTGRTVHENVAPPAPPPNLTARYCDAAYRAAENHHRLSRSIFPLDILPVACADLGPGSLATLLGSEPGFAEHTVWFNPAFEDCAEPEHLPPLRFDANNQWWRVTEALLRACVDRARGCYFVAAPDLICNMDILSSLRGAQTLCMDMLERPEWIEQKIREINAVWFEAYRRTYDIIRQPDGSSAYGAFYIWGPGKVSMVQCDASAMFSAEMFRRFVVPALTEQCAWLDHTLYHLDGTQALQHLDALLEIEPLDALEWTPQAGIETGGNARWHDLYRRVLAAGKSVQVVEVRPAEIVPLLDAIGNRGVYLQVKYQTERELEEVARMVEPYY